MSKAASFSRATRKTWRKEGYISIAYDVKLSNGHDLTSRRGFYCLLDMLFSLLGLTSLMMLYMFVAKSCRMLHTCLLIHWSLKILGVSCSHSVRVIWSFVKAGSWRARVWSSTLQFVRGGQLLCPSEEPGHADGQWKILQCTSGQPHLGKFCSSDEL